MNLFFVGLCTLLTPDPRVALRRYVHVHTSKSRKDEVLVVRAVQIVSMVSFVYHRAREVAIIKIARPSIFTNCFCQVSQLLISCSKIVVLG